MSRFIWRRTVLTLFLLPAEVAAGMGVELVVAADRAVLASQPLQDLLPLCPAAIRWVVVL